MQDFPLEPDDRSVERRLRHDGGQVLCDVLPDQHIEHGDSGARGGLTGSVLRARAQALPCAVAHGRQHQREGETGGEDGRLRGHEAAAEQQRDGDEPLEDAPERALGDRRVQLAAGRDGVDDCLTSDHCGPFEGVR